MSKGCIFHFYVSNFYINKTLRYPFRITLQTIFMLLSLFRFVSSVFTGEKAKSKKCIFYAIPFASHSHVKHTFHEIFKCNGKFVLLANIRKGG